MKNILLLYLSLFRFLFGWAFKEYKYNSRCMKYFGNQGYPNNYYCKLFVGEIKARDEQ
jgi:hypothetical protein